MGNIGEAVEHEDKLCDEVQTVQELTYLGDRVIAGGGCETALTASTNCGWVKLRGCSELLYGRRFFLKLKGAVHRCYLSPAILYGTGEWCLKESEMRGVLFKG